MLSPYKDSKVTCELVTHPPPPYCRAPVARNWSISPFNQDLHPHLLQGGVGLKLPIGRGGDTGANLFSLRLRLSNKLGGRGQVVVYAGSHWFKKASSKIAASYLVACCC